MGKFLEYVNKSNKKEEEKKSVSKSSQIGNFGRYALTKSFGLDTLQTDLESSIKTVSNIYNGWQTKETMQNTLSSVQSMYDRLTKYQDYQKQYGGTDLSDVQSWYKSALDDWGTLTEVYGKYKNADAFNVYKKNTQLSNQFKGLTYEGVQAEKKKYKPDSDEYKFLDTYTGYTDLREFDKALGDGVSKDALDTLKKYDDKIKTLSRNAMNIRNPNAVETFKKALESANKEREDYIKSLGFENEEAFNKRVSFTNDLETARNTHKLDHAFDLHKDVMQNKDFAKKSKYVSTEGNLDGWWEKLGNGQYDMGYGDLTYEYINNQVDGIRDEIISKQNTYSSDSFLPKESLKDKGYDRLNPEEVAVYNYWHDYDKQNGTKKAQEFLDDMEVTLSKRIYDESTKKWKDTVDKGVLPSIGMSAATVPANIVGGVLGTADALADKIQGKEYNPYSFYKMGSNFANDTRGYVSENIAEATEGMELFGQNVPSFLYQTGMSVLDSKTGGAFLGKAHTVLMGSNAYMQKAKELTEEGVDVSTVQANALVSGALETAFEYAGFEHLMKMKTPDSLFKAITSGLKSQGVVEGLEELGTSAGNIIADLHFRGKDSQYIKMHNDLIARGYTEKEANTKTALAIVGELGWSFAGGFLSGVALGGSQGVNDYNVVSSAGQNIKANERTSEVFDIASNPEVATAYEAYTKYAKKGINADNIKDAQLGSLYISAKQDAIKTINSKDATPEQKASAMGTLGRLALVDTENTIGKRAKELNVGEETKVTKTGETIEIKGIETSGDETFVVTDNGKISVKDATLTQKDSELVAFAESISKTDGADVANLFVSQYDGKMDLYEYANSFNLTVAYAKNNYRYDEILNKKGELTAGQVNAIYEEVRIKADKEKQKAIYKLNEKMADGKFYKGFIDDSVIDYNNTSAEGKINWNDLTARQREAVTFVKGFAQATGMNLSFVANNPDFNGRYDRTSNTITINLDKGGFDAIKNIEESIIPTMSHETTHWMKDKAPELWRHLNEIVFSTLTEHLNSNEADRIAFFGESAKERTITEEDLINREFNRLKNREKKNGVKEEDLDIDALEQEAREEIISRACEDILRMSEQGRKIFHSLSETEQKSLFEKIKGIINDLLTWANNLLNSYEATSPEARIMREYKEQLQKAAKVWDEMLKKSVVANQSMEKSGAFEHNAELGEKLLESSKLLYNEKLIETHMDSLEENYSEESALPLETILSRYNKTIEIWKRLGGELNSDFLKDWNKQVGKDRTFTIFKKQAGYKYNVELSSMCKKGIPLFEAIDRIVKDEAVRELKSGIIGKAEKEILYDILKENHFEIPCAICYVEQARQREGDIISAFLNGKVEKTASGKVTQYKLGWNDTLKRIQNEMAKSGISYEFPSLDRSVATDKYTPLDITMDEEIQEAYFEALKKIANEEIRRYNKAEGKSRKLITKTDAQSLKSVFSGKLPLNLQMFRALFNEPSSRVMIDEDLLYSSMTTLNLASYHNGLYSLFNSQGGVGGYKTKQGSIIYWGDILKKTWKPNDLRNEGGVRNQSNSDFLMYTFLDHAQMYIDFTAKGYYLQAYTKVIPELKLFGLSKGKINASFIPKVVIYRNADGSIDVEKTQENAGLDENGNPIYDDIEGIPHEEAFMLIEDGEYSKCIGGVCIGYSDKHILKLLDDNRIQLIIGFHDKSNDTSKRYKGAIYSKNYNGINEATKKKDGKTVHIGFNKFIKQAENKFKGKESITYKGKTYTWNDVPKLAADLYLEHCESKGLYPAYSQGGTDFSKHPNYYKLLADFSLYDSNGNYAPHEKVEYNLPDQVPYLDENGNKAYESTEGYIKRELKKELAVRDAIAEKLADKSEDGIIPQFVKRANALYEGRNDILHSEKDSDDENVLKNNKKSDKMEIDDSIEFDDEFSEIFNTAISMVAIQKVRMYVFPPFNISQSDANEQATRWAHDDSVETGAQAIAFYKNKSYIIEKFDSADLKYIIKGLIKYDDYRNIRRELEANAKNRKSESVEELASVYDKRNRQRNTSQGRGQGVDSVAIEYREQDNTLQRLDKDKDSKRKTESDSNRSDERNSTNKQNKIVLSEKGDSVYDTMGETERVIKENEKLRADVERLRERMKLERTVTHGNVLNNNQLLSVAGHLRKLSRSQIDKVELANKLKDLYSFIGQSENLTWEEVYRRSYVIADAMFNEAKPDIEVNDYFKEILWDVKNSKVRLSESQKAEASHIFGSHWNRNFFGKTIISNDGISLEAQWMEWAEKYPGTFKEDITEADMITELYNIITSVKEASEIILDYDAEENRRWLANEIYNQYWNVSSVKTMADRHEKKVKQLNFEHRKAMSELREDYKTRMSDQKKADRERYIKLANEIRERKDKEIALAKEKGRERLDRYKENAERKTRIQSITANILSLNEMLVKNSKDKHIPEAMKGPVTALIKAINFSSKRMLDKGLPTQKDISLQNALSKVKDMMVEATNAHDELVELYGHGLDEDIKKMVESVDNIMRTIGDNELVLNNMTATDLQTLDKVVKTIKHAVNKLNKFHTVNHARGIANLSRESVVYMDSLGKAKIYDAKTLRGRSKKLLEWGNALPYYAFKRFGDGGMKVYEALQDGWDKFAFNIKKIMDTANETYTSKEVKEWSKEVKTFKILIPASESERNDPDYEPQYQEVKLTIPQIMSLYCLNKREQARGHLFQGGIRVADFKTEKGNVISQAEGVVFTEKEISEILDSLTDRQREVADGLQKFMNTVCAEWGNDVSMARFGYKAFGEENYFPIQSDKNNLAVNDETEQVNSLFKLLNMSFTKNTIEKANNRIVISDIFDVFAQHTSDMAKYNALALPVLDSFKWYNYTEKQDVAEGTFKTKGVKQAIENAFGKDGQNYFTTFLKDINGQQEVSRDTLGGGFFKNAKIAAVGANLRVILLQPTSYVRASAVMDSKYLMKASAYIKVEPIGMVKKLKKSIENAEKYCGMALWKSMGYYDTNVQKGVEAQIKHDFTWKDKATDIAMKGAEIADKVTWGTLWTACEFEIRDTRSDLKPGTKEYFEAVGKRLREIIYATQVVDSTMTRSQMMRSSDGKDKMLTAFASEPTLSYNMLQDAYMGYSLDARQIGRKEAIKKNGKKVARTVFAYTMTNALAALVESGFDFLRDDDDEEMDVAKFMELYLSNFASDMSITAKIPYIKEVHSILQGFNSSRTDTQWMESTVKAVTGWYKVFVEGKGTPSTIIKNSLKAFSDLSGLPVYNIYRDIMASVNKVDLFTTEDLNEMFGDFLD